MQIKLSQKLYSKDKETVFLVFQIDEKISFHEWQFMMIECNLHGRTIKRAYSISTTNKQLQEKWEIGFIVKKASEWWMSKYFVDDIEIWDSITTTWPFWHMTNPHTSFNYLLISIWSWLWPVYAHYTNIVHETSKYAKLVNLWGNRFYWNILPEIENNFLSKTDNIKNHFYLSKEPNLPNWYKKWYIQDSLDEAIDYLWTDIQVFICGKPDMVDDIIIKLEELWVEKWKMQFEKY